MRLSMIVALVAVTLASGSEGWAQQVPPGLGGSGNLATATNGPRTTDFTQRILNLDNVPFRQCVRPTQGGGCAQEEDMTLGFMAVTALQTRFPDEQNLPPLEQTRRAALAIRVYQQPRVTLTAEEVQLIKTLVAKLGYNTVAVYRVYQLLDPASVP